MKKIAGLRKIIFDISMLVLKIFDEIINWYWSLFFKNDIKWIYDVCNKNNIDIKSMRWYQYNVIINANPRCAHEEYINVICDFEMRIMDETNNKYCAQWEYAQ